MDYFLYMKASQRFWTRFGAPLLSLGLFSTPSLQGALPVYSYAQPAGLPKGETEIAFQGARLEDFEGFVFYSPGFEMKSVKSVKPNRVEVVLSVGPEVPLGNHLLRIRTKSGLSFIKQIFVGPYQNVKEVEPNNDGEVAQSVEMHRTVEGLVTQEDVDHYKIQAKKGDRISLEIEAMRLGNVEFDPYIALINSNGFEVASSDDTILHRQDGYLSYIAPEDGEYKILVRESSYRGNNQSFYRLHVGNFRRPDVVYPAGGRMGSKVKMRFIESNGEFTEQEITLPAAPKDRHGVFLANNPAPSPNIVRVTDLPEYVEPQDGKNEVRNTALAAPVAINGILSAENESDAFRVTMKKGQKVDFVVYAQSLGSPLDPFFSIHNEKGAQLAANDDGVIAGGRRLDSKQSFTAPADGNYELRIRDHLNRGGLNYVYRIEGSTSTPLLAISSPHFAVNDSHKRQFFPIAKGNRYATLVNISRNSVSGDVKIEAPNLPPGVKIVNPILPGDQTTYPVLLEAAADAPLGGAAVPFNLKPVDEKQQVQGKIAQVFDMIRTGNIVYYTETVDKHAVAVLEEAPYTLELTKPQAPIVANGVLPLKVVAKRKEGFKAPIRVLMVWRPNGMSSQGEIDIPEGKTEAEFMLDCKADVKPGTYQLTVLGETDLGKGTVYAASPFCDVVVQPAYLTGTMAMTVVEQGQETLMVCKLEQAVPFEGEAVAELVGLPAGATAEPVKFKKDAQEIQFKLKTAPNATVGKHSTVFCQVQVPVASASATHRIAVGTTLRIDAPRKAVAAAPKPAAPKAVATGEQKKALSRLEQLRQQQSQ